MIQVLSFIKHVRNKNPFKASFGNMFYFYEGITNMIISGNEQPLSDIMK